MLRVLAAGAVAAVVSCWPVVFSGRSFVSPLNGGLAELYERPPYVPGVANGAVRNVHGSDTAAMTWAFVPYARVQHRAIFQDHELPLWDRYNACGVPLLGQGLSMLGDPLHWLPVLANGAAWAWDTRFVIAKSLWCGGIGLLVLLATGHVPAAMLLATASAWIGFFSFRINHPAFFTLSYAPWILVCWFGIARAGTLSDAVRWIVGGTCVTWMVLASGTVKEAVLLIACLHLTGGLLWWLTPMAASLRRRVSWRLLAGGAGCVAFTAPLWATFAEALAHSHTSSDEPFVVWTPLSLLPGFFDDLFTRAFNPEGNVSGPSANGVMLAGVLWLLVKYRRGTRDPAVRAMTLGALLPFALTFGIIPSDVILAIPLLRNALALDNVGGCVLLVHVGVLAGAGFAACWRDGSRRGWFGDWALMVAGLTAMLAVHFVLTPDIHRTLTRLFNVGKDTPVIHDGSFWRHAGLLAAAVAALPWAWRTVANSWTRMAGLIWLGIVVGALAWRHGMYAEAPGGGPYVTLGPRLDVRHTSPALTRLAPDPERPQRVVGFARAFFPGYSGIHAIEGIGGPDALQDPRYRELLLAAGLKPIWSWWFRIRQLEAPLVRPLLDLLNVGWYVGQPDGRPQPDLPGLVRVGRLDLDIWQSPTVWPRAFFTDAVSPCDSAEALVAMVHAGDGRPFATADPEDLARVPGLLDLARVGARRRISNARAYRLTANTTSLTVHAPGPGVAILTECWAGGAVTARLLRVPPEAGLNGRKVDVIRANHAFRAVVIPAAGIWTVEFRHRPRVLPWALAAAALAAVLTLGTRWLRLRPRAALGPAAPGRRAASIVETWRSPSRRPGSRSA